MNNLEMAKALFGGSKEVSKASGQTTTVYGVAASDSSAGFVMVDLGGDTVSTDDDQIIEVETTFAIKEGDEVIVQLVGADGTGKAPTVIGVVGRGDEMQNQIESVTNYFWHDAAGAHVSTNDHSVLGRNVLLDNDSLDIRNGTSDSEADQTVLASFGREVTVGSRTSGFGVGDYSQVFGWACVASGEYSHAEGQATIASGDYSHSEGFTTEASGKWSHAEGDHATASGPDSHAEGYHASASGTGSHAEGRSTQATKMGAHAEGNLTEATGDYAHAEGAWSKATDEAAHAEGTTTTASGKYSHAEGSRTTAASNSQHAQGRYNVTDSSSTYADIVGNGSGTIPPTYSNAYNLDWNGNAEFQGEVYVGGCTPNGETPYPVVRYNTSASKSEYWSGSAWTAVPGGGHNYATRSVVFTATINGGGNAGDNLYDRINNDLPAGWSFFTISGTATNSGNGLVLSAAYRDNSASLRVRNMGTTSISITTTIFYIAVQN